MSSTLQVTRHVLTHGAGIQDAVDAPRGHALLNGKVWIEEPAVVDGMMDTLKQRYSRIICKKAQDYRFGCVQALAWDEDGNASAAADPRRDGEAWTAEAEDAKDAAR